MICHAQEDEGTKEAKNQQLLAEDIDSILARAEVRRHLHLACSHILTNGPEVCKNACCCIGTSVDFGYSLLQRAQYLHSSCSCAAHAV